MVAAKLWCSGGLSSFSALSGFQCGHECSVADSVTGHVSVPFLCHHSTRGSASILGILARGWITELIKQRLSCWNPQKHYGFHLIKSGGFFP